MRVGFPPLSQPELLPLLLLLLLENLLPTDAATADAILRPRDSSCTYYSFRHRTRVCHARWFPPSVSTRTATWPLHDIAISNIVWCMAFKGRVGGRACIAQWLCNSIAIGHGFASGVGGYKDDGHPQ